MKLNKPKYSLFKNTAYAIAGLKDILKNETSFKIQVFCFIFISIVLYFLNIELHFKVILFLSLFIPLFAEIVNSSIERTVDLVTKEYFDLAKRAKDLGATLVFVSIIFTILIWILTLYFALN